MSGAEAIAVLGLIGSIISIVDATKKVYDAATNAQGLPEAFPEVAARLPIVENILGSTYRYIKEGKVNSDACKGVEQVAKACEEKAKKLEELFHKTIPGDDASHRERYIKAVKILGKGNKVEKLMEGIMRDVNCLAFERGTKTATEAQQKQILEAIEEMEAVPPSVLDHGFQETGFTMTDSGSGTHYNTQGEYIAQGSARQYNNSNSGDIHFGQIHNDTCTQYLSVPCPNEGEVDACLSALSQTDLRDDREKLINTKGDRVDGTCEWIRGHALYESWLGSQSQLLWLSGGPGKGKTMLSIFLAEELEGIARLSQNKLFLQYFCDNKDEERNTAVAVLRGLIYQLLDTRRELFKYIPPRFRKQKDSLFSFETLWRIFKNMVCDPALETTYCVLDGLDECDEASLKILLGKFTALFSEKPIESSTCHLNLLIVSRDLPDCIPEFLSSFPRIFLDPDADTEINKDIDLFIKAKVEKLSRRRKYPQKLREHVEDVFRERAQGTFLWIGIVAQALRKYQKTQVEQALESFPPGLDELYARILRQIKSHQCELAARILSWVVMAFRPLTVSELSVAMEGTIESTLFTPVEVIREYVSEDCRNILVINEEDEVGLIHQSAKDYLLRKTPDSDPELEAFRVKEEVANLEIARKCLDYLESGALENRESEPQQLLRNPGHLRDFPLLLYAALYWHEHARSLARSEDIFDLSRPFYHEKSQIRTSWLEAYWASEVYGRPPKSFTLLHLASFFGILPLAEIIVFTEGGMNETERLDYLNKSDGRGSTALMWAAERGHEAVVPLLLEEGADIGATDDWEYTALMRAALHGHEAVVQLLLDKGADIEAKKNFWGQTALVVAAKYGLEAMVRLLLEKGADIEAIDDEGQTALLKAVQYEQKDVVRLLLEKGADIEATDDKGQTALMKAARYGNGAIVQVLLEKGADINARAENGDTALMKVERVEKTWHLYRKSAYEATIRLLTPNLNS